MNTKFRKDSPLVISGTFEHTAQMVYIINQARTKQRSLMVTLLDLKNASGEVHHNLIHSVLGYHHIPDQKPIHKLMIIRVDKVSNQIYTILSQAVN